MITIVTYSLGLEGHKPPEQMGTVVSRCAEIMNKKIVIYLSFYSQSLKLIFHLVIEIIIENS